MDKNIKRVYEEELRDKKRAANGVHSLKGKRGLVGSVKTPADLLKGKAKREYEGTSKVVISSVYEHFIPIKEFKKLTKRERTLYLYEWRKKHTAKEICEGIGLSDLHQVYYLFRSHGVESQKKTKEASGGKGAAEIKEALPPSPSESVVEKAPCTPDPEDYYCDVRISGKLTGRELAKKLQGLALMALEDGHYELDLRFTEL